MDNPKTPKELKQAITKKKYCNSVDIKIYNDHPAMVIIVKVTFWTKIRCLLSWSHYRSLTNELDLLLIKSIPKDIEYCLIFEL